VIQTVQFGHQVFIRIPAGRSDAVSAGDTVGATLKIMNTFQSSSIIISRLILHIADIKSHNILELNASNPYFLRIDH